MNMTPPDLSNAAPLDGANSRETGSTVTTTPETQTPAPAAAHEAADAPAEHAPGPVTDAEIDRVMTELADYGIPERHEGALFALVDEARSHLQPVQFVWELGHKGRAILTDDGLRVEGASDPLAVLALANATLPALVNRSDVRQIVQSAAASDNDPACAVSQAGETLWSAMVGDDDDLRGAASDIVLDLINRVYDEEAEETDENDPAAAGPELPADVPGDIQDEIAHAMRPDGVLNAAFDLVGATGQAMLRLTAASDGESFQMELVDPLEAAARSDGDRDLWQQIEATTLREGVALVERLQGGGLAVRSAQTHTVAPVKGWPGMPCYTLEPVAA